MSNLSNQFHAAYAAVIAPKLPNKFVTNRCITLARLTPQRHSAPPYFTLMGESKSNTQTPTTCAPNDDITPLKMTSKKIRSTSLSDLSNPNGSLYSKSMGKSICAAARAATTASMVNDSWICSPH